MDRELGEAQVEIKALRLSDRVREKACEKNLEFKNINDDKKIAMAAKFAAEATLIRVHAAQKDYDMPPIEAILASLEVELKLARQEVTAETFQAQRSLGYGGNVKANRVAVVVANEWKVVNDKVILVRQWLKDRRFMQGEMQQLRDKLVVVEHTATSAKDCIGGVVVDDMANIIVRQLLYLDVVDPTKLTDFGLAQWVSSSSSNMTCNDVAGTFGYFAPEYFMYGKVTEKIDVYAYGVVLLEILLGRKHVSSGCPKGEESLVMWAKKILQEDKVKQLVDPCLGDKYDSEQLERMILAASIYIRHAPRSRPRITLIRNLFLTLLLHLLLPVLDYLGGDDRPAKSHDEKLSILKVVSTASYASEDPFSIESLPSKHQTCS